MPAFAQLDNLVVLRADVRLPRGGVWTATLTLDGDTVPTGRVTLTTNEGAVSFAGTVVPRFSGVSATGRVEVFMVGGAGGLARPLPARSYRNTTARQVVEQLASESGEALSSASDAALLATQLPHWSRFRAPASQSLDALAAALGATWRIDRAGQLVVLPTSTATTATTTGQYLGDDPTAGAALYALDLLDLEPGQAINGRVATAVHHRITSDAIRSRVTFA